MIHWNISDASLGTEALVYNATGTVNLEGIELSNTNLVIKNGEEDITKGTININSGTVSSEDKAAIRNYGIISHSGGTVSSNSTSELTVNNQATGSYTLSGGSITSSASNAFNNLGTFEMTSGTMTTNGNSPTYVNNGGTTTLKSGTIQNTGNNSLVYNLAGITNIEGINLTNTNRVVLNGDPDNTTAILNINSGTISSEEASAINNYAAVNHSGGTVSSTSTSKVTVTNQATGSYTLSGGTIKSLINTVSNVGTFVMTSGTLTADGNYLTYYNNGGAATFRGGNIIQSQNNNALIYNKAGTTNIDGINLANKGVAIQNGDSENTTAVLNINSGTISSEEVSVIRNYATVNHSGGTVSSNTTSVYNFATGSYTLSGGSITSSAGNAFINLGTFEMTSGTITTDGNYPTYANNGGTTTFNGGTIIQSQNNKPLIYNIAGTTNIEGINLTNKGVAVQNGDHDNTTAILNINSGTISSEENLAISNYATVNHSDGTVSSSATDSVTVANRATGSYTLNGGMITSKTNVFSNLGTFVMTSGTMTTDGNYPTYYNNGGTATFQGGTIQNPGNKTPIYNKAGTTNIDGINLTNKGTTVQNGDSDNTTAILNVKSGTISSEETSAINNHATVNHSGGTLSSSSTSKVTVTNQATGSYTLSGGSITSSAANTFSNRGTFTMTSGTLTTDGNYPTYYNNGGTTTIKGGTIIQSQNNNSLVYNKAGTINIDGMSFTHNANVLKNGDTTDDSIIMNLTNCNITSTGSTAITNYGSLTITNGSVTSSAANAINNSSKVTLKGNAKITSSIKNYPTIYNKSGATLTKDSTVTVTNTGGGTAIYNAS